MKSSPQSIIRVITRYFKEVKDTYNSPKGITIVNKQGVWENLEEALEFLNPLVDGTQYTKVIGLSTTYKNWVAVFANSVDPSRHYNLGKYLSYKLKTESINYLHVDHTLNKDKSGKLTGNYGATQLYIYSQGEIKRSINLLYDRKWIFSDQGSPYMFEQLGRYKLREKRKRFDISLLKLYLAELNLYPFNDEFYLVKQADQTFGVGMELHDAKVSKLFKNVAIKEIN